MSILDDNAELTACVGAIAEVAGYLWSKGWAERNGGNLTVNVTGMADFESCRGVAGPYKLDFTLPNLRGQYFFCKGTGKRMRDMARWPMQNGCIIRVLPTCNSYEVIADEAIMPTSELSSHLLAHDYLLGKGAACRATLHTHPTELIALSHNDMFLKKEVVTRLLWSMIPEARMFCPKGLGVVPYQMPGTTGLAEETVKMLDECNVVLWEKHGAFTADRDILSAFDKIDVLNKSALIYQSAKAMGFEPSGLSEEQMEQLANAFDEAQVKQRP